MKITKVRWIRPRCSGRNPLRVWKCRRSGARAGLERRWATALLWAGALR